MSSTAQTAAPATGVRERRVAIEQETLHADIIQRVRQRLSENGSCPCGFYLSDVQCKRCQSVVTVRGRVSTFRLKRVLLSLIENLDGVSEIDDHVDVISSTGLSSVRPR
jgi:hypothetical protein